MCVCVCVYVYIFVYIRGNEFYIFCSNGSKIVCLILRPFSDGRTFGGPFVVDLSIILATAALPSLPPTEVTTRNAIKFTRRIVSLTFSSFFFLPSFAYTCRETILYCIPRVNFTVLGNDSADSCYKSAFH